MARASVQDRRSRERTVADCNNYLLVRGNPTGERLSKIARKTGMLLMGCDQCCYQRAIADKLIEGVPIGCFPDLYKALSGVEVHQVITL